MAKMTNAQLAAENAQLRAALEELRSEYRSLHELFLKDRHALELAEPRLEELRREVAQLNDDLSSLPLENAALRNKLRSAEMHEAALIAQRSAPAAWQDGAAQRKALWDAAIAAGKKPLKFAGGKLECAA